MTPVCSEKPAFTGLVALFALNGRQRSPGKFLPSPARISKLRYSP